MNNKDTLSIILEFFEKEDLINLKNVNKEFSSEDILWREIGKRYFPILKINSEIEYRYKNPFCIREDEIKSEIERFDFLKKTFNTILINKNRKKDHIVGALVKSIARDMLIVQKLRNLKASWPEADLDWKIGMGILIEQYLDRSEEDVEEIKYWIGKN